MMFMINRLTLLFILLLPVSLHATVLTGRVVGVTDGDTITVLVDNTQLKIRLTGIDAPEQGQPYGNAAKERLSDLVFGKEGYVQTTTDLGRWLFYEHCADDYRSLPLSVSHATATLVLMPPSYGHRSQRGVVMLTL